MKAIQRISIIVGLSALALVGCTTPSPHPMPMDVAVQNAKTKADHEALAEHYEQTAKDFLAKVTEHRKLLDQYESRPYLYGKQGAGLGLKTHCETLVGLYQKAADANMQMAKLHRQIASTEQ